MRLNCLVLIIFVVTTFSQATYSAIKRPTDLSGNLKILKSSLVSLKGQLNLLCGKLGDLNKKICESYSVLFIRPKDMDAIGKDFKSLVDSIKSKILIKSISDNFSGVSILPTFGVLLMAGAHGDYDAIFEKSFNIQYLTNKIVQPIQSTNQATKFDIIIVEACITGYVMNAFKDLLKTDGILIGTVTSTPDVLASISIFTEIKENKPLDKKLIVQSILGKTKGQLVKSIIDQKSNFNQTDFKRYVENKGLNLSDGEINRILKTGVSVDFTEPFENFKSGEKYKGNVLRDSINKCIRRIKEFMEQNKTVVATLPHDVREWDWDSVLRNFLEGVPDSSATYDWSKINDSILGHLRSALALIHESIKNKPLIDFLDQNPPATILVYSKSKNKYYYEKWISTDFAKKIGTYSESGSFETVNSEFEKIKKRYSTEEQKKFESVSDIVGKLKEIWGV